MLVGELPEKPLRRPVKEEKCAYTHFPSFQKIVIMAMSKDECDLYDCFSFYRVRIEITKVACAWTAAFRFASIVFIWHQQCMSKK